VTESFNRVFFLPARYTASHQYTGSPTVVAAGRQVCEDQQTGAYLTL